MAHLTSGSANINDELDVEAAALIAKTVLDDAADDIGCCKGKGLADALPSDEEIALRLQVEEYNEWLSIAKDAKRSKSIGDALAAYLDALTTAQEAATEDRIAAELLSRDEALPVPKSCQTRLEHPDFVMNPVFIITPEINITQARLDGSNNDIVENGLLDYETIDNELVDTLFRVELRCTICYDSCRCFETLNVPCGHYYCRDCLVTLVEAFTRDESLFPLRCCQDPIPIAEVLPTLPLGLRVLLQRKHAEFSIVSKDRLYCSSPTCSTFVGSSEGHSFLAGIECPSCHVKTCPQCKELAHPDERCGVNASNEAFHALARSQGWQTCPGCHAVVELNHGCYCMTCRCRTQFCYLCGAHWETCAGACAK